MAIIETPSNNFEQLPNHKEAENFSYLTISVAPIAILPKGDMSFDKKSTT